MSARRTRRCQLCGRKEVTPLIGATLCRECAPDLHGAREMLARLRAYLWETDSPEVVRHARLDRQATEFAAWLAVFIDERGRRAGNHPVSISRPGPSCRECGRTCADIGGLCRDCAPDEDLARAILARAGVWLREVDSAPGTTDSARVNRAVAAFAAPLARFVDDRLRRRLELERARAGEGAGAPGTWADSDGASRGGAGA